MDNNSKSDDSLIETLPSFVREGVSLSLHTTFKIGGVAKYFVEVKSMDEFKQVVGVVSGDKLPIFFLGGGSNTVFQDDGYDGVVIKNCIKGIEILSEDGESVLLKVFAGESWDDFVSLCVSKGWCGLENLTAIPGTVGGAVVQNIGAYGVEVKDLIESVDTINFKNFDLKTINKKDLMFGYRDSVFKKKEFKNIFIVSAQFKLKKNSLANLSYKDLKIFFQDKEGEVTIKDVRDALKEIRGNKFPDLNIYGTAGSFFKNIIVGKDMLGELQKEFGEIPFFEVENDQIKIPTGFVLDKICGMRGFREGDLGLYENQSLVVVNFGSATSDDLKKFISKIKQIVFDKTGITLEEEVLIVRGLGVR